LVASTPVLWAAAAKGRKVVINVAATRFMGDVWAIVSRTPA
jgi:hypothetical protein